MFSCFAHPNDNFPDRPTVGVDDNKGVPCYGEWLKLPSLFIN